MDLLSILPDEIHCHISSFLTTKEAALTSLLKKKWRNLLAFVPHLDVDDSEFLHPEDDKRERDGILESFMDFVDRVLALQGNSPIKKLSLKCETGVSHARVNSWICKLLQRGVKDLDLSINFKDEYYLPQELFVSETLVNLKISNAFGLCWWTGAKGTFLPMLKTLDVYSLRVFCGDKIELFLPCFPVLEVFKMDTMEWTDLDETVSSATLTKLLISGNRSHNSKSISFDTPNLLSLIYSDLVAEDYPLLNLKKLIEARIVLEVSDDQIMRVRAPDNDLFEDDVVLKFGNVVKLMNGIKNVQQLHLCPRGAFSLL